MGPRGVLPKSCSRRLDLVGMSGRRGIGATKGSESGSSGEYTSKS